MFEMPSVFISSSITSYLFYYICIHYVTKLVRILYNHADDFPFIVSPRGLSIIMFIAAIVFLIARFIISWILSSETFVHVIVMFLIITYIGDQLSSLFDTTGVTRTYTITRTYHPHSRSEPCCLDHESSEIPAPHDSDIASLSDHVQSITNLTHTIPNEANIEPPTITISSNSDTAENITIKSAGDLSQESPVTTDNDIEKPVFRRINRNIHANSDPIN